MLKFGIKSAILGSAVYYTIEKGVWKDSATTNALYEELESGISPYVGELKKQVPYEEIEKGVWKDSATTNALYEELESGISPYVGELKKQVPYELPPLPSNDRVGYLFKYYWNTGVKMTFRFIAHLPTHISDATSSTYQYVSDYLQSVESKESAQDK